MDETFFSISRPSAHDINLAPAAGRAGDDLGPALPESQGLQYRKPGAHFFHRVSRERYPQGVADAFSQQYAQAHRGFYSAGKQGPGFGYADVQRVAGFSRQQPVGVNRGYDIRRLSSIFLCSGTTDPQTAQCCAARFPPGPRASARRTVCGYPSPATRN